MSCCSMGSWCTIHYNCQEIHSPKESHWWTFLVRVLFYLSFDIKDYLGPKHRIYKSALLWLLGNAGLTNTFLSYQWLAKQEFPVIIFFPMHLLCAQETLPEAQHSCKCGAIVRTSQHVALLGLFPVHQGVEAKSKGKVFIMSNGLSFILHTSNKTFLSNI